MSLYRLAVHNGLLIREKRKLFRWWIWSFNRSEEDHLIRMKNRLTKLRQEQSFLMSAIPEEEERLKEQKEAILAHGHEGHGPARRDSWTARTPPQRLQKDVKLSGKKKKAKDPPAPPKPLFNISQAP